MKNTKNRRVRKPTIGRFSRIEYTNADGQKAVGVFNDRSILNNGWVTFAAGFDDATGEMIYTRRKLSTVKVLRTRREVELPHDNLVKQEERIRKKYRRGNCQPKESAGLPKPCLKGSREIDTTGLKYWRPKKGHQPVIIKRKPRKKKREQPQVYRLPQHMEYLTQTLEAPITQVNTCLFPEAYDAPQTLQEARH